MTKVKDYSTVSSSTIHSMEKTYNRLIFLKCPKQITRTEFLFPSSSSPNKQYNLYIQICQWLLVVIDKQAEKSVLLDVEEYEDPNLTAHKLLDCLRSLNFTTTNDYPIIRVKQPFGEVACNILDFLTKRAILDLDIDKEREAKEDDINIAENNILEEEEEDTTISKDDEEVQIRDTSKSYTSPPPATTSWDTNRRIEHDTLQETVHQSTVSLPTKKEDERTIANLLEWRQELERVRPLLACTHISDKLAVQEQQSWRLLVNQIVYMHGNNFLKETKASELAFEWLTQDAASKKADIKSMEKIINDKFHHVVNEYKELMVKVTDLQEKRQNHQSELKKAGEDLITVSRMLAEVKSKVDEKGNSITDTSQIVKMKMALNSMKSEIRTFDAEIAMLEHTVLHRKLQLRSPLNRLEV
jgi:estrogen-related receptor beta like 1